MKTFGAVRSEKRLPRFCLAPRGSRRWLRAAIVSPAVVVCAVIGLWTCAFADTLTLEQAVQRAQERNPDAKIAAARIEEAAAGIRQADSAFWPHLQVSAGYQRTNNPMQAFGSILSQRAFTPDVNFNSPGDTDDLNLRAGVVYPLLSGGRDSAARDMANSGYEAARAGAAAVKNQLAFEVARAFFTTLKAEKFMAAAEANVKALESNYDVAKRRFNAGTALKSDMLDVGVQLARAREDRAKVKNAAAIAKKSLANLLDAGDEEVCPNPAGPTILIPESPDYEHHPELKAVREKISAAEAAVRKANAGYYPRVSAFGRYDHDQGWMYDGTGDSWTAGVMLEADLFDGMLTSGRVQEARSQLIQAQEEERRTKLRLDLEMTQARLSLDEARQRLAVTEQAAVQAEESAQLTRARFEQGLTTTTELLSAETALTAAKVRRAESEADERIAVAMVRKAAGISF